jgi:hypothetical protein
MILFRMREPEPSCETAVSQEPSNNMFLLVGQLWRVGWTCRTAARVMIGPPPSANPGRRPRQLRTN